MRIWHVGASHTLNRVDGVNATVWQVARAQAADGCVVTLLVDAVPDAPTRLAADGWGVKVEPVPGTRLYYDPVRLRSLLSACRPDVVHMHSVFIPAQAVLARHLRVLGIPYVITPNGGLSPQVLRRGVVKKRVYSFLVERARFRGAAAVTAVSPGEVEEILAFVPAYHGRVRCIPNPVNVDELGQVAWQVPDDAHTLVYLGRFDVLHKGIDRIVELGRCLPEVEIHLYGQVDPRTRDLLASVVRAAPPNVRFHEPVYGVAKSGVLARAGMYIQVSRWEGFALSVAEAMWLGVPCAVTSELRMAEVIRNHDLGLVLPPDLSEAAALIARALGNVRLLSGWSERARAYATERFGPSAVARQYVDLYQEVLGRG